MTIHEKIVFLCLNGWKIISGLDEHTFLEPPDFLYDHYYIDWSRVDWAFEIQERYMRGKLTPTEIF